MDRDVILKASKKGGGGIVFQRKKISCFLKNIDNLLLRVIEAGAVSNPV